MLLLHGLGGDSTDWQGVAPVLAESSYVVAPDLRGHGESGRPGSYSFEVMRDDVLALVDELGLSPVAVVGHSMGGTVALLVAEAEPATVERLVLEDSPPPTGRGELRTAPAEAPEPVPFDWPVVPAILGQCARPDPAWWDDLDRLDMPVLVVGGGPSSHVDQAELVELVDRIPGARHVRLDAGHHVHSTDPAGFLSAVRPFLAESPPAPSQG